MKKNSVWIVSFLESKIPEVAISQVGTVKHGNSVPITCNLTERGSRQDSKLLNVSLSKNGVLIHRANVSEDPPNSTILLGPLNLKNVGVNDGGTYACLLEVLLKNKTPYKVTDSTLLRSKCILLILQHFFLYIFVLRSRKYVKGNNWSFPRKKKNVLKQTFCLWPISLYLDLRLRVRFLKKIQDPKTNFEVLY